MTRLLTTALVAAAFALPANAESIRISTVGKSPEQLNAEISRAAHKVCRAAGADATLYIEAYRACVKQSLTDAREQLAGTRVAAVPPKRVAQR